jgi:D-amino-acid dehydrogenase
MNPSSNSVDVAVLGAGVVGVSVAVHLAMRGRAVVLVDRRAPGCETSFGNAGLIHREGVRPQAFPTSLGAILGYALNDRTDARYDLASLPAMAPFLARYWRHSLARNYQAVVKSYAPLIASSLAEHERLITAAGAEALVARRGWLQLYRTGRALEAAFAEADGLAREHDIRSVKLDAHGVEGLEPALTASLAGGVHWQDSWTVDDPHALTMAYCSLFESLGGSIRVGDADTLTQLPNGGWTLATDGGAITSRDVVVALGPWSAILLKTLGYQLPLGVKRGYHMHYRPAPSAPLTNWIQDAETGFILAPMRQGVRLTTGAELAPLDAPKSPIQLAQAEQAARELLPLGERLDDEPWMGARPCTPDMLPVIGPAPGRPGLWLAFGHAHHGLTLGPATGRLLAEQICGEETFVDAGAFGVGRLL